MRRLLLVAVVAAAAIVGALVVLGQDRPEYTTSSTKAYALFLSGEECLSAFQGAAAESLLTEAVRLDPSFAMAQAVLGEVAAGLNHREKARAAADLADSLAAGLPRENERLLVQLRLSGYDSHYHDKRDSLLTLLEARLPEHPAVLVAKALMANRRLDSKAEDIAWREVLRVDPNYARAYNWLGYAAAREGRYLEALSYLRRYAFLAPHLANPHDSLGEIYTHVGEFEAAEQEFRQALQIQGDFYYSLLGLARVYVAQGRLRKGQELLEQTRAQLAGIGMGDRVDEFMIALYISHGYFREAEAALARLSAGDGKSADHAFLRGLQLALQGRTQAAMAWNDSIHAIRLKKASTEESETARRQIDAQYHALRAVVSGLSGEPTQEVAEWGRALIDAHRLPPHERWTLQFRYGESLARLGQPEQALEQAREILAVNPRLIGPLLLQARCEIALGRAEAARITLTRLDAALARADADLGAVAEADSLRRVLGARPPA